MCLYGEDATVDDTQDLPKLIKERNP